MRDIKNLRFGNVVTDIVADGSFCFVTSNEAYTLEINDRKYNFAPGKNTLTLKEGRR